MSDTLLPEDREILDTHGMLAEGFLKNLPTKTAKAIQNASPLKSTGPRQEPMIESETPPSIPGGVEKLLIGMYEIRDELIETFEKIGISSSVASELTDTINKVGTYISLLGGEVEEFTPLDHVSGLAMPTLEKNAMKVLETTKQCYSIGTVQDCSIGENGSLISIAFEGRDEHGTEFKAFGKIKSPYWTGNEAVDYVYTKGGGKMSVKAFEEGRWNDKSASYDVSWDLVEGPAGSIIGKSISTASQKVEKNEAHREEVEPEAQNNTDKEVDDEADLNDDFRVQESE